MSTSSLENNKYATGVFIDLKKAFDTVDHDRLSKKYNSTVCLVSHKWIQGYLENRKQFVNVCNFDSETQSLNVSPTGFYFRTKVIYHVH